MASLRPPSTSPSPSPAPGSGSLAQQNGRNPNARASMGPTRLGSGNLAPSSPRPVGITGVGRPASELLGSGGMFQTPESEAIDQWFENLQNYEATLEEMAAASLDVNFKEELSAIEQWFRVLSEAERTAALYSLLQHSTQVQIRFFITVLQQMARSDPMTALLSPSVGSGSMQAQMEAKLSSMGLKSPGINSPSTRSFSATQRQSLAVDGSNYLSPDAANKLAPSGHSHSSDAAATLAQQRAKLKANAAHRISAPGTLAAVADSNLWSQGVSKLGQLAESSASPSNDDSDAPINTNIRPKSTDFSGAIRNNNLRSNSTDSDDQPLSPMGQGASWASMVNTPAVPMFNHQETNGQTIDTVASRLNSWSISNANGGKMQLEDAKKYRRVSKNPPASDTTSSSNNSQGVYDENGNLVQNNGQQPGQARGGVRSVSAGAPGGGNHGQFLGAGQPWNGGGARSPSGFSSVSSNRFGSDDGMAQFANMASFGLGNGVGSPGMAALGMPGFGGMTGLNMNMLQAMNGMNGMNGLGGLNLGAGLDPLQAQLLAAQLAASGGVFNPAMFGMGSANSMRSSARSNGRSPSGKTSLSSRDGKDKEEEVDPKLLEDIPAWLRSLRLHKYTPNFQGVHWKDMVVMDEPALEAKGVAALGARRKMLKTFELVRAKMGIDMSNPPPIPA